MSQYGRMERAFAGMRAEEYSFNDQIRSGCAKQVINFGYPVFSYEGDNTSLYNYFLDTATLTFSTDLSASNSTVVTINSVALDAVVYATSHAATMTAIVAAVEAAGYDATYSGDILYIRSKGATITATAVVTGGSAVTVASTYSSDQVFRGIAKWTVKQIENGATTPRYEIYDSVPVVEKGIYWCVINDVTILEDQAVNIDNSGAGIGNFTNISGDSTGCFFRSADITQTDLTDYLAIIELRGIKKLNAVISW